MRYKIGDHGIGGWNESWYFAEYDPETGRAYWVRVWDNLDHKFNSSEGEKRLPLEEAAGQSFYEKAVEVIQNNHPEWKPKKA
ncbi:hypothetical protein [Pseudomonas sp. RW405]|uniref:hypothetical protein n=1 Tax=Pseudomonas sp. RW405 TaxID=2202652 RepID=UPI000D739F0B|nr:hypothetical protein [Pseudomonas sp. RW405]PWY39038.1 hypothetical protein DK184_24965 [Pseudomonas sp. RW405]